MSKGLNIFPFCRKVAATINRIKIENTDVLHGIRIPDLKIRGDDIIEFTADKTGEFDWYCTNMCGEEHMQMKGKLIVK